MERKVFAVVAILALAGAVLATLVILTYGYTDGPSGCNQHVRAHCVRYLEQREPDASYYSYEKICGYMIRLCEEQPAAALTDVVL